MVLSHFAMVLVLSGGALLLTTACGDDPERVANRITCSDVCQRYADCFDANYDVEGCVDRCTNDATADEEKEERLEVCQACIDERSCASAVFSCTTECTPFVP